MQVFKNQQFFEEKKPTRYQLFKTGRNLTFIFLVQEGHKFDFHISYHIEILFGV